MTAWLAAVHQRSWRRSPPSPGPTQTVRQQFVRLHWSRPSAWRGNRNVSGSRAGQRLDERPRGLAEWHGARAGLRIREPDRVYADVAPAQIEHFAPVASGERQQPDCGDGLRLRRRTIEGHRSLQVVPHGHRQSAPGAKPMTGTPSNAYAATSPARHPRTNASRSMTAGRSCIDSSTLSVTAQLMSCSTLSNSCGTSVCRTPSGQPPAVQIGNPADLASHASLTD